MQLRESILLANGQTVEVWDLSRPIAADTQKVELLFRMTLELHPGDFDLPDHYAEVQRVFGAEPSFEYRMERSFVPHLQGERTVQELIAAFGRDTLPYLARPDFPRRFARSRYREITKDPYRYAVGKEKETTA
ncbi:MAG: hypothetical protein M0009_16045 [Deltaproteobacteria bacterium]|nr:hypothetical protein [Deltaproteobacteria bacterium]